jgi:hypothetical protein
MWQCSSLSHAVVFLFAVRAHDYWRNHLNRNRIGIDDIVAAANSLYCYIACFHIIQYDVMMLVWVWMDLFGHYA